MGIGEERIGSNTYQSRDQEQWVFNKPPQLSYPENKNFSQIPYEKKLVW